MQIIAFNRCWVIRLRWLLVTLVCFSLLMGLAIWQLNRAAGKTVLLQRLAQLQTEGVVDAEKFQQLDPDAVDGLNIKAHAHWVSPMVWLLDNQIVQGRVGYDVIVPMRLDLTGTLLLVNLGWLAAPVARAELPKVNIAESFEIQGMLRTHFGGIRLGQNFEDNGLWPMRIQQLDLVALGASLKAPLYSGVVYQLKNSPYLVHYQSVVMPPERHRAYALQWFLLGLCVLAVALAASVNKVIPNGSK